MLTRPVPSLLLILGLAVAATACRGPFPAAAKQGIPADHTVDLKGVLHKPGYKNPYRESSGCSAADCHHEDLDGGVAKVEGRSTIAPSCFQCHGTKWSDD